MDANGGKRMPGKKIEKWGFQGVYVPTGVSKISCRECLINSMPDCAESLIAFYVSCVPTTSLMVEVRIEAKHV